VLGRFCIRAPGDALLDRAGCWALAAASIGAATFRLAAAARSTGVPLDRVPGPHSR
jgi:hypothetical protein